ncbi:MAG: metallophosphoesterase [Candidatus Eremiobacteraeota bacterium]|nr:metallophosphoesterase [Candidatus Eremiobacteraeota bacterium]
MTFPLSRFLLQPTRHTLAVGAFIAVVFTLNRMPQFAAAAQDPIVVAVGDIACDELPGATDSDKGGGCHQAGTAAVAQSLHPAAVLTLGDEQYPAGSYDQFMNSYDKTWGTLKSVTHPAAGNHEYESALGAGYFRYFGEAAGSPRTGYYSFDLGGWHFIAINGNCSAIGGCAAGSAQERWLAADLAAHPAACTLAYWHQPRFSSGEHHSDKGYQALWQDLYDAHADVVLNGHDHDYERFSPQTPSGESDRKNGIREFVVGTGGKSHYSFTLTEPNSELRNDDTFGVLALTLHPYGYSWQFVAEASGHFTDSGSGLCHGRGSP